MVFLMQEKVSRRVAKTGSAEPNAGAARRRKSHHSLAEGQQTCGTAADSPRQTACSLARLFLLR
ncbi:MAG: hypothetical protein Q8R72_03910 [Hylemonella sp.]|nr:hypothetical protein [Hylemonella sp.]